jgi:GMP synthase (glutamine-hydrolysing)
MNVTFFQHSTAHDSGTIGKTLERLGAKCRYIPTALADLENFDPLEPDLLVVLGGSPGVYQSNEYPFLKGEFKILEKRLAHDKPTLGICLGAQLMAAALGAAVFKGSQGVERGWCEISVTPEGQATPIAEFDRAQTRIMQWHQDTFDLPDGSVLLATSEMYRNQIFSWGKNALALQCHVEVDEEIVYQGLMVRAANEVAAGRLNLNQMREETALYLPPLMQTTETFIKRWVAQIGLT